MCSPFRRPYCITYIYRDRLKRRNKINNVHLIVVVVIKITINFKKKNSDDIITTRIEFIVLYLFCRGRLALFYGKTNFPDITSNVGFHSRMESPPPHGLVETLDEKLPT